MVIAPGGVTALKYAVHAPIDESHHESGEIAHVHDLDGIGRRPRHRHVAALREAHRPVREAVGRIERAHDVARAHDRGARAVGVAHVLLAERLHRPVGLVRDLFLVLVLEHAGRRADVVRLREARVGRDARDVEAVARVRREQVRRHLRVLRDVAGVVDDDVPLASLQRVELALAVAVQRLDVFDAIRIALAAVEVRDLPAARERELRHVRPDEPGAAEDQHRARAFVFGASGGLRRVRAPCRRRLSGSCDVTVSSRAPQRAPAGT